jgi:hypothetical protein
VRVSFHMAAISSIWSRGRARARRDRVLSLRIQADRWFSRPDACRRGRVRMLDCPGIGVEEKGDLWEHLQSV